ncbi:MAG: AbrB/MazE/SpoVT family DNA-binding domain-containing protein [Phycisphaerae bacterium]|nr:AbrB/MazE/SpoVT family DNA-binding domain-containing protein [Phycisphaerae bacterium]
MDTAKLFKNGRSQAVRLPKEYAMTGDEVYVKRINGILLLIPKDKDLWGGFVDSLDRFSDDFLGGKRDQGAFERRDAIR